MRVETITYDSPVDALVALVRQLVAYEQRYQMPSAEFFAQYQAGKLGDSADVVEWAGDYQLYLCPVQELKAGLKEATSVRLRTPHLANPAKDRAFELDVREEGPHG